MRKKIFENDLKFKPEIYFPSYSSEFSSSIQPTKNVAKPPEARNSYSNNDDPLITLEILSRAISNRTGLPLEEAMKDAEHVLNFFGFEDRIIDNMLEPADRQLFYILEEEGILTTEREIYMLPDGRDWRTHYWKMKKDIIMKYYSEHAMRDTIKIRDNLEENKKESPEDIYRELDDELWHRF